MLGHQLIKVELKLDLNGLDDLDNNNQNLPSMYRVCIVGWYHPKNLEFLHFAVKSLGWVLVNDGRGTDTRFNGVDIVFSGTEYIPCHLYPKTRFIFGPHFSVFPNYSVHMLDNQYKNAIYIQPSQQVVDFWVHEHAIDTILPVIPFAFGVNTEKFKPSDCVKEKVLVYYKRRDLVELNYLREFLQSKGIHQYTLIKYGEYSEQEYINLLDEATYAIWLGSHESQGFALEEAMSMDVPLLVWSTESMSQEYGCPQEYKGIKTRMITVPYWNSMCGEVFYRAFELARVFDIFQSNLHQYTPRRFVLDNLSMNKRAIVLSNMVNENFNKNLE